MDITREVKEALINAFQDTALDAFNLSQNRVPVRTGKLKASGKVTIEPESASIKYAAPYSSEVNDGTKPGNRHVKSYIKMSGTIVRDYSYFSRGQRATHFMDGSIEESFKEFASKFGLELGRIPGIKIIRVK